MIKKISLAITALLFAGLQVQAQTMLKPTAEALEPTETMALLQVLVTSIDGVPSNGDKVNFVNKTTQEAFGGTSNKEGRFDVLIPKGTVYDIVVTVLGKDTLMRQFTVPAEPEFITINYTFKYEPPRTIRLDRVYFDTNKASIRPESFSMLNDLVEFLNNKPSIVIEIAGHTDNIGGEKPNQILSQNRANAVKNYLVKKGIKSNRLKPVGYGISRPIASNDTAEGRQKNRRTEVYILEESVNQTDSIAKQ